MPLEAWRLFIGGPANLNIGEGGGKKARERSDVMSPNKEERETSYHINLEVS